MQNTGEHREGWFPSGRGEALFSGILKAKVTALGTLEIYH